MTNKLDKKELKLLLNTLGGLFAFVGGIFLIFLTHSTAEFNCIRQNESGGYCLYKEDDLLRSDPIKFDLANIEGIEITSEEECEDFICQTVYTAELKTLDDEYHTIAGCDNTDLPCINSYVNQINDFIDDPEQEELNITVKDEGFMYVIHLIISFMFIFGGIGYAIFNFVKAVIWSKKQKGI